MIEQESRGNHGNGKCCAPSLSLHAPRHLTNLSGSLELGQTLQMVWSSTNPTPRYGRAPHCPPSPVPCQFLVILLLFWYILDSPSSTFHLGTTLLLNPTFLPPIPQPGSAAPKPHPPKHHWSSSLPICHASLGLSNADGSQAATFTPPPWWERAADMCACRPERAAIAVKCMHHALTQLQVYEDTLAIEGEASILRGAEGNGTRQCAVRQVLLGFGSQTKACI